MNTPIPSFQALPAPPAAETRRNSVFGGLALISIGVLLLFGQFVRWVDFGGVILLFLGAVFAAWGAFSRKEGLFVPAGILAGLGAGVVAQGLAPGFVDRDALFLIFFAGGWFAITAMVLLFRGKLWIWPAFPGGILGLIGVSDLLNLSLRPFSMLTQWWPGLLIAAGVWVLLGAARKR